MERVKAEIRVKASRRRDRKYVELLENSADVGRHGHDHDNDDNSRADISYRTDASMSGTPDTHHTACSNRDHSTPASTVGSPPVLRTGGNEAILAFDMVKDVDLHYVMIYLDSTFTYLFPYYHPHPLSGGKGWVLQSLLANKSVYHTAVSLSSYFFAILLAASDENNHEACTAAMVKNLQGQLELGLQELQREMQVLNSRPAGTGTLEALICMQSIVQMCIFEIATANKDSWMMHLQAAITLFQDQLVPTPGVWTRTLDSFETGQWPDMSLRKPYTSNQQALRFWTAQLVYMDIISSITLERVPRLYSYQPTLIPGCVLRPRGPEAVRPGPIYMDEYMGTHNAILQMLSDVVALETWKKEQRRAGSLAVSELISRGEAVGDALKMYIAKMDEFIAGGFEAADECSAGGPDFLAELQAPPPDGLPGFPTHNLIWALAVQTYYCLVISGWQPSIPNVSSNVKRITELLLSLPKGTHLRATSLPLCIAGCLSPPEQEDTFRTLVNAVGPLRVFGTIKDVILVMEAVWARRSQIDESWDLSKCLNILGYKVIIV